MPRKPGSLSPEGSGKGSLSLGQSGQGARAVANQRANAGKVAANLYKTTSFGKTNPMISSYKGSLPKLKPMNTYNSTTSTDYTIPIGLGLIGGATVLGSNALKERLKRDAIKKASGKTRKGQSRGR